ncbi:MAG: AbgT family transporter [Clostridia bacterium]|nr:AbgT family transporter [Clostridia bacterium]
MSQKNENKVSLYNRCLNGIERVGNKLPHSIALFAILALLIVVWLLTGLPIGIGTSIFYPAI